MGFYIVLIQEIAGYTDFTVQNLTITDGFLIAGEYRTPLSNILFIKEV